MYCVNARLPAATRRGRPARSAARRRPPAPGRSAARTPAYSTSAPSPITPTRRRESPVSQRGNKPDYATVPGPRQIERSSTASIACTARASGSRSTTPSTATSPTRRTRRSLCLARDGGLLHQLGRVPQLEGAPDRELHAVPARRIRRRAPASTRSSPADWSSPTASTSRAMTPSACRCTCRRRRSRTTPTRSCGATSGRRRSCAPTAHGPQSVVDPAQRQDDQDAHHGRLRGISTPI